MTVFVKGLLSLSLLFEHAFSSLTVNTDRIILREAEKQTTKMPDHKIYYNYVGVILNPA